MWRLFVFAGLLTAAVCAELDGKAEAKLDEAPAKRSPASAVYGAGPPQQGHYVLRDEAQELGPEYLGLLQQYLEARQQHQQQPQQVSRARLGHLIEQELVRLAERPVAPPLKHHQGIPLEVEQYHVETSPRRPFHQHQHQPQPQLPPPPPPPQPQPQPQHHSQHHSQVQHPQVFYPVEEVIQHQGQQAPAPQQQQQLRYHQAIPIQYGYEDERQVQEQQQSPHSIVRAQAQAEAQALAFQKIAQAAHYKHQDEALEQIRVANEKHHQQQTSALEQIRQGEQVSEAGRQERVQPKDPEGAYKARLKAQATALVAEQRRAQEASEYKAHADAILKLQAQQRAHLRAQEEAHHYALNFEKNQQRAQAQAQAIANAQALALYKAHQAARNKAQNEAKQAARAQAEARRVDPDHAPVVQYLLPNKVPLPAPEVYLPKAAEALRAEAAAQKRLQKKPQQQLKHLLIEDIEPQLLRHGARPQEQQQHPQQQQQIAFLVDAGYYRKSAQPQQRPLLRQAEYQGLEEVQQVTPRSHYQQYHQQIDSDKLALLVPVESQ